MATTHVQAARETSALGLLPARRSVLLTLDLLTTDCYEVIHSALLPSRVALVYLHASDDRQHVLADTVSKMTRAALCKPAKQPAVWHGSGT